MVYTIVVHLYAKADPTAVSKLKAKLAEASEVYSKDKETLSWFVMQDIKDERAFTIVERYEKESVCLSLLFLQFYVLGRVREYGKGNCC
jgi:quinol monooxygenase YgiN